MSQKSACRFRVSSFWSFFAVLYGVFICGSFAHAQAPAAVPTNAEVRAQSIFAEAENFKLPEGWAIVNGHGIDMYTPGVSGGKTVHNPVEGTANLDVVVPEDGAYTMWAWFTKWMADRNFELRVEQNGQIVATSTFSRPQDKQGTWSYTLQKGEAVAQLKAGPAKLILYAPPFSGYVGAALDAVLLTKAANYTKPDWKDFSPQTFVRFTMLTPQAPPAKAEVRSALHRDPWGASGISISEEQGTYVPTGKASPWVDISKVLGTAREPATALFSFQSATPMPPLWKLRLEIASKPAEASILKTFEEEWDGNTAGYVMPGDTARYPEDIESVNAATRRHVKFAQSLKLPGGEGDFRPKVLSLESFANSFSPRLRVDENNVLVKMGINSVQHYIYNEIQGKVPMDPTKSWAQNHIHVSGLVNCSFDLEMQAKLDKFLTDWVADLKRTSPLSFATIQGVTLADEPGTPNGLTHIIQHTLDHEPFRAWLKARGDTPQEFGLNDWAEVKPVMPDPKASVAMRRLGWLSSRFAQETSPLPFQHATQLLQKLFGRPIATRVNFSDESLSGYGNIMSNGDRINWFEFARAKGSTMPETEDWLYENPHLTPFLADLLRSTKATQNVPLGMYIIWGYGPPVDARSAEIRTMTALARGVKNINHYWYGPHYASTECAFSEDERYDASVARVNRIAGLADDVLGRAMPPARKVAILWSQATEQWKTDDAFTVERRMLHHALSMQQIPVDFIDEKEILSRLNEYRVLFLPANNLVAQSAAAIGNWVQAGGTLVVCGGGPERDETNEPSQALFNLSGLQKVEMRKDALGYRGEAAELKDVKATTQVTLVGGNAPGGTITIPVAGYKAVLTPAPGARVLGSYTEGGAAIVENISGKGRVLTFGFNPGLSLLIKMEVGKLAPRAFWNVFPANELHLISAPVSQAGVLAPVATQTGIDAARLDGPNGSAVTLVNLTLNPIAKLGVLVRDVKARRAVSVLHGPLPIKRTKEGLMLELPLDTTDIIKLYR